MIKPQEVQVGKRVRTTREFTDEWLDDEITFDGGLHEPIHVPEGAEGVIHSLRSHGAYVDVQYPSVHGWPKAQEEGGVRVQTSIFDIEML